MKRCRERAVIYSPAQNEEIVSMIRELDGESALSLVSKNRPDLILEFLKRDGALSWDVLEQGPPWWLVRIQRRR